MLLIICPGSSAVAHLSQITPAFLLVLWRSLVPPIYSMLIVLPYRLSRCAADTPALTLCCCIERLWWLVSLYGFRRLSPQPMKAYCSLHSKDLFMTFSAAGSMALPPCIREQINHDPCHESTMSQLAEGWNDVRGSIFLASGSSSEPTCCCCPSGSFLV